MQCPVCSNARLVMSERQGIEIDYCPQCRGVWLDRGELDKIIDRSQGATPAPSAAQPRAQAHVQQPYAAQPPQPQPYPPQQGGYYHKKKREGFLSDIFDFD
ncbi:zf-TFIIB domain-containing protein [Hylemonella sp. W303a]|uniref:TFIIB-type zinc ribbon-containing protein n=1 Tax=Hylemonella sp. W303a TaxID=3389873 RepID=UPI00396B3CD8